MSNDFQKAGKEMLLFLKNTWMVAACPVLIACILASRIEMINANQWILWILILSGLIEMLAGSKRKKFLAIVIPTLVIAGAAVCSVLFFVDREAFELVILWGKGHLFLLPMLVVLLIFYVIKRNFRGKMLLLAALTGLLIACGIFEIFVGRILVGLEVFLLLNLLSDLCQRIWYGREREQAQSLLLTAMIAAAMCFLPVNEEPIRWEKVVEAWHQMEELRDELVYQFYLKTEKIPGDFGVATMGYSQDQGTVGGSVTAGDLVMLRISTNRQNCNRIYLAGTIYGDYNGTGWDSETAESFDGDLNTDRGMELLTHLYGLSRTNQVELTDGTIFRELHGTVAMGAMKTRSILYPENCFSIFVNNLNAGNKVVQGGDNVRLAEPVPKDGTYSFYFWEINSQDQRWINGINELDKLSEDENFYSAKALEQLGAESVLTGSNVFRARMEQLLQTADSQSLQERYERQREENSGLPESVPSRVYDLANEITAGCGTDYEKAAAIEAYLKTHYQYQGRVSDYEGDVTDSFLFESGKGYCTYFATAMTVLCRCVDIPARYVEGITYYRGAKPGDYKEIEGKYAHAWCEVLLPGYGFSVFDPTPGYERESSIKWPSAGEIVSGNGLTVSQNAYVPPAVSDNSLEGKEQETHNQAKRAAFGSAAVMAVLILLFLLSLAVVAVYQKIRYAGFSSREKAIYCMGKIRTSLERLLHKKGGSTDGMGLRELFAEAETLELDQRERVKVDFSYMADFYEEIRFGNRDISGLELIYLEQAEQTLQKKIRLEKRKNVSIISNKQKEIKRTRKLGKNRRRE